MKISVITASKNNRAELERAINSVQEQTHKDVEHIIVDSLSNDGTVDMVKSFQKTYSSILLLSEKDNGIYEAINKGIKVSSGDVIALLHSDDFYASPDVLQKYNECFTINNVEAVYSDLVYVSSYTENKEYKVVRYWKTHKSQFTTEAQRHRDLKFGWMPPHPTLFLKKSVFEKAGLYNESYKIAGDYEMILRLFWKEKIKSYYLPVTTYCMTVGGASNKSIKNIIKKSSEDYKAMKSNGMLLPEFVLLSKNLRKIKQFFIK